WETLTSIHRIVPYKLRLLRDYGPVIWNDADFDQTYLYRLLEVKFRRMRQRAEKHRIVADWENQAREYLICETVFKRLLADEYVSLDEYVSSTIDDSPQAIARRRREWKYEENMRKQDIAIFCRLFERKVQTWWD